MRYFLVETDSRCFLLKGTKSFEIRIKVKLVLKQLLINLPKIYSEL